MTLVAKYRYRPRAGAIFAFRRVTVEGSSMEPTLAPGDRLLLFPAWGLRVGDIVAVPDPRDRGRLLVKRVRSLDHGQNLVTVEGDNPDQSTDSRVFGPVPRRSVVGRAVYRYAPAAGAGPVGGAG
ncbi:MAG: S26 family signal peptidase [Actinomycetota bacterium]|nr:S26 family signal peptidase [Actinomycetota bacterium]